MKQRGFSLIELLVTLALIGIAAAVVLPLAAVVNERAKETELRAALRTIRRALDEYKQAADSGAIDKATGSSGYPKNLEILMTGVARSSGAGANTMPMQFLRRIPRDPFFEDSNVPDAQTWRTRSYGSPVGDFSGGEDVFDIGSRSEKSALDGSLVKNW